MEVIQKTNSADNADASIVFPANPGNRYEITAISLCYDGAPVIGTGSFEIEGVIPDDVGKVPVTLVHSIVENLTLVSPYPLTSLPNRELKITITDSGVPGTVGRVSAAVKLIKE